MCRVPNAQNSHHAKGMAVQGWEAALLILRFQGGNNLRCRGRECGCESRRSLTEGNVGIVALILIKLFIYELSLKNKPDI